MSRPTVAPTWHFVFRPPAASDRRSPYLWRRGVLHAGPCEIRAYQLSDGRIVLNCDDLHDAAFQLRQAWAGAVSPPRSGAGAMASPAW